MNFLAGILSLLSLFLFTSDVFSTDCYSLNQPDYEEFGTILDITKKNRQELYLRLPKTFVLGWQSLEREYILEFIPEGEQITDWSEIITIRINLLTGKLEDYINEFKSAFFADLNKDEILRTEHKIFKENQKATAFFVADTASIRLRAKLHHANRRINGKNEFLMMKLMNVGQKLVNVQYAIKYDDTLTAKEKQELINKMHAFFKNCKIIDAVKML